MLLDRYDSVELDFYPRSPCGERRTSSTIKLTAGDFYPRSPCGERPEAQDGYKDTVTISIHALLAESDCFSVPNRLKVTISIHALLAESDRLKSLKE